jgi:hypothetical protein
MDDSKRKKLSIASSVLALAAWLNQKFQVFGQMVTAWLTTASTVVGLIAKFA